MKKKTKIILGVVVLVLVALVGSFVGLVVKRNSDHEFGLHMYSEGPWGSDNTWVSDNGNSYLISKDHAVTAYFKTVEGWQDYEFNYIDRLVYLDKVEGGVTVATKQGRMKFDGTIFTVYDLEKDTFGSDEFHYVITDKEFNPN